jgi:hypothetical protein
VADVAGQRRGTSQRRGRIGDAIELAENAG